MDKETKSEMITRGVLKASYTFLETLDKRKELQLKIPPTSGCHKKQQLALISQETDLISDQRLIHKGILHQHQRSSKHKTTRWIFLDNVDTIKIKHIEEKLFPIIEVRINSKKPIKPEVYKHAIFIGRHFLERIALREETDSLDVMLQTCRPYIMALIQNEEACDSMLEDNEIRMLSEDACTYMKLMTFKGKLKEKYQCDKGYVLNTFIPKSIWSKRRSALLTPLVTDIKAANANPINIGHKAVVVLKPSSLNEETKVEIMSEEIKIIVA